jgi:hypothetical protein
MDYTKLTYSVEWYESVPYEKAIRVWKTMYPDFKDFAKNVISCESMQDFGKHCLDIWDNIEILTPKDAFSETNIELRRVFFKAIGIEKIFRELEPELLHEETLELDNLTWDITEKQARNNKIKDTYSLYKIKQEKLFGPHRQWNQSDVYAVKCKCTTTGREYWIYVPSFIGSKNDAIEAIAWTVRLNITDPEMIYRQGDILVAKASSDSRQVPLYHLSRKTYISKLVAQS